MKFDIRKANEVLVAVAEGATLRQIARRKGMPKTGDVFKWTRQVPEFAKSLKEAEEWSARMLEEEALDTSRDVLKTPDKDTTSAARVLNEQLRWSAERRDVAKYGNSVKSSVVVPVQIVTSLNLGQSDALKAQEERSVYELEAKSVVDVPFEEVPALPPPPKVHGPVTERAVGRTVKAHKRILTPRNPFWTASDKAERRQKVAEITQETTDASQSAVQQREQRPVSAPQGLKRRSEAGSERGSSGEGGQEPVQEGRGAV